MTQNKVRQQSTIQDEVMEQIRSGTVQMRPKWRILAGAFLLGFGTLATLILSLYWLGLSWYRLRIHNSVDYLWFGRSGLQAFWAAFPWVFMLLGSMCLMIGVWALYHYDIWYKWRWQTLIVGVLLGTVTASYMLTGVGIYRALSHVRWMKPFFLEYREKQEWYKAQVHAIDDRKMTVQALRHERPMRVEWNEDTRLPQGLVFDTGHWILLVGDWEDGLFKARGILRVPTPLGDDW
jgi:hypothetical protein